MELIFSFATDDDISLKKDDHFGKAKYFKIYHYKDGKWEFIEKRENKKIMEDESLIHGDPKKAKAVSSILENVDVMVGRKFGPNIKRLINKFVFVVIRETDSIEEALKLIEKNMQRVIEEKNKEERKVIVLRPD